MIDQATGVIDYAHARTRRLQRRADPLGVEVRTDGWSFALYGPDRGLFIHPQGVGRLVRWLSYDEAQSILEHHLAAGPSRK